MKKLAIKFARVDFHARVQDKSGKLDTLPASVLLFYYDRLTELMDKGQLNPENIRKLLREQAELTRAIEQEGNRLRLPPESGSGEARRQMVAAPSEAPVPQRSVDSEV
jgi:hypothetical protein